MHRACLPHRTLHVMTGRAAPVPSLNNEGCAIAPGLLLDQSSSMATSTLPLSSSVSRTGWGQSLPPCLGSVPALGLPGPAYSLHGAWPEAGQSLPPWDSVTNKWASASWAAAVSLVLARKRKQSVKTSLPCLALLSPGYQSCREAVAAYYNCPEAPLEDQVLMPS